MKVLNEFKYSAFEVVAGSFQEGRRNVGDGFFYRQILEVQLFF